MGEIVKVLARGARLLILDEPTAVLTPQVSDNVFIIIRQLTDEGVSILLIRRKMREGMQSGYVRVYRRGRCIATVLAREELDEPMALSDRIAVVFGGSILVLFPRGGADVSTIGTPHGWPDRRRRMTAREIPG